MAVCWSSARERSAASLATLHLGIEPALLALLTGTGAISSAAGGWVVGAGQLGMSAGALICWRSMAAAGPTAALIAALLGTACALALAIVPHLGGVLILRLLLGCAMGLLMARATAVAARAQPHHAIGVILLGQQFLATIVMAALPLAAAQWGAAWALAALATVPLAAGLLVHHKANRSVAPLPLPLQRAQHDAGPPFFASLATMALLIAVTVMIWSYVGTVGESAGVSDQIIGIAIAIATLASAPAALLASLTVPQHERWITALICGSAMLSPLLPPPGSGLFCYIATMALFNAGSTFAIIRFSAWTMERCADGRERRAVVMAQCVATAGGAPLGAVAIATGDLPALTMLAAACAMAAIFVQLAARYGLAASVIPSRRFRRATAAVPLRPV